MWEEKGVFRMGRCAHRISHDERHRYGQMLVGDKDMHSALMSTQGRRTVSIDLQACGSCKVLSRENRDTRRRVTWSNLEECQIAFETESCCR